MHADSLKRHIEHLEDSHKKLETELRDLEKHHMDDSVRAHELKKMKLKLKDEIEHCNQSLHENFVMPNLG